MGRILKLLTGALEQCKGLSSNSAAVLPADIEQMGRCYPWAMRRTYHLTRQSC